MSGFSHHRIDERPPCTKLGFCLTADLTGNGREDVIVGGAGEGFPGKGVVWEAERRGIPTAAFRSAVGIGESNLFWYENPGFERHDISFTPSLDVGGAVGDITGDGRPNVVAGQGIDNTELYWFEPGPDPRDPWARHLITDRFEKYHDVTVADIDDDGEPEVIGLSQESETVFYYDIPPEPQGSPWDDEYLHIVDEGRELEGVEVADIDGDGELEVVLSEGDSPHLGSHPGRVAWFDPPDWEETIIADGLFCPHSLEVEDFTGDGLPDIYVAEMGLGKHSDPRHFVFYNRGGRFERETVATGIETHEAKVVDLTGSGQPDVVGKSYGPDHHVDVWFNRS